MQILRLKIAIIKKCYKYITTLKMIMFYKNINEYNKLKTKE